MKLLFENWRRYQTMMERINELGSGKRFVSDNLVEITEEDNKTGLPEDQLEKIKKWAGLSGQAEFLGRGSRGSAFKFGDKVVKITNDPNETKGAALIAGQDHPNVYKIDKVGRRSQEDIDKGYEDFAARWKPIMDVFADNDIKFGLEVHPTEIAYDIITAKRALDAIGWHPAFGFNFDPSHFIHQFIDPVEFIDEFGERIWHVHVKDSRVQLTGRNSILASHLDFGDSQRGWDFVSPGRGDVKWDHMIRALNRVGYSGPLSIEWEDSGMDRDWGAPEALQMVRSQDFTPSEVAFDAAFTAKD